MVSLYEKIRAYAAIKASRGVVLLNCSARNVGGFTVGYYDHDATSPDPDWQRQLIGDFQILGVCFQKNHTRPCYIDYSELGNGDLPIILNYGAGLLNNTTGGRHPQGWYCSHLPSVNFFDVGGEYPFSGCSFFGWLDPIEPDAWGFDGATWYAEQNNTVKSFVLPYVYYKIKCLDPYAHFRMPGWLIYFDITYDTSHLQPAVYETAPDVYTTFYAYKINPNAPNAKCSALPPSAYDPSATNMEPIITNIWNGGFASNSNWILHDFTFENVSDWYMDVASRILFSFCRR